MELSPDDVSSHYRSANIDAVRGCSSHISLISDIAVVRVHEVEVGVLRDAGEDGMTRHSVVSEADSVPTHVRDFERTTTVAGCATWQPDDFATENSKPGQIALFGSFEKHLHSKTNAQEWSPRGGEFSDSARQLAIVKLLHHRVVGADAGKNRRVSVRDNLRGRGDDGITTDDSDRFFDAVDVGSAGVDDGEAELLQRLRLVPVTISGGSSRSMYRAIINMQSDKRLSHTSSLGFSNMPSS